MEETILEKLEEYFNDKVKIYVEFSDIREYIISVLILNETRIKVKYKWDYHLTDEANVMNIIVLIENTIVKKFRKGIE